MDVAEHGAGIEGILAAVILAAPGGHRAASGGRGRPRCGGRARRRGNREPGTSRAPAAGILAAPVAHLAAVELGIYRKAIACIEGMLAAPIEPRPRWTCSPPWSWASTARAASLGLDAVDVLAAPVEPRLRWPSSPPVVLAGLDAVAELAAPAEPRPR